MKILHDIELTDLAEYQMIISLLCDYVELSSGFHKYMKKRRNIVINRFGQYDFRDLVHGIVNNEGANIAIMKWKIWNRIVTAATLCALVLLAGSHGASAADGSMVLTDKHSTHVTSSSFIKLNKTATNSNR